MAKEVAPDRSLRVAIAFAIASTLFRADLAHHHYGFQTGDDLEIAEQAFRRAVGLVHTPWNVRSLFIPDVLVAPFVYAGHVAGVRDSLALAEIARYPFILLAGMNVLLVFLLGRRWCGDRAGLVASGLYALHWMPLVYGSSLYPRTVAVTCILGAAILLEAASPGRAVLAGLLAAVAVTARYSEAVFFISLLVAGSVRNRRTVVPLVAAFFVGVALVAGLYDYLTWGRWFGSLIEFAELTFVRRDAASREVTQPLWWYVGNVLHWLPATLLPLLVVAWRGTQRRAIAYLAIPLLVLSAIFHKELRYLQVVVPFALLLAACGFATWRQRRLAAVLVVLAIPLVLGRIGTAAKRSTNAVDAARWMASQNPASVGLSQAWAYGGRLFLGNEALIADVGVPPDLGVIRRLAPTFSALGVYSSDAGVALRTACVDSGLSEMRTFAGRGGHAVTVFYRPVSASERSRPTSAPR
jgi:hypothetical protein